MMKKKWYSVLSYVGVLSLCFFLNNNTHASESLDDGMLGLTKIELREKLGKPDFLYSEEEPVRRYVITKLEDESALRATFLYDVIIHDLYHIKKNDRSFEYRFYYGEDPSEGKKTLRVREYSVKFSDGPIALGKIGDFMPEFKQAYSSPKVFQERLLNYNNIRLIFVTNKVSDFSRHMGALFTDPDKDIKDWSLSYHVILCDGEPENVSANSMVKEIKVLVDGEYRIGKSAKTFGTKLVKNPLQ
ncbi:MAG: hypothetical protein U0586_15995 [Candidatus Brocadiaceae bacterium]